MSGTALNLIQKNQQKKLQNNTKQDTKYEN